MRLLTFCLVLFIFSCGSGNDPLDCSLVLPPSSNFFLKFEDLQGNSLIGTTFPQDSFRLYNPNSELYLKPLTTDPQDRLLVWLQEINSNQTYFLELSQQDTDTLTIGHELVEYPCFNYYRLNQFIYNDVILFEDDISNGPGTFVIVKE